MGMVPAWLLHTRDAIVKSRLSGGGGGRRRGRGELRRAVLLLALLCFDFTSSAAVFSIDEATVDDIQAAFASHSLTSVELVSYYLRRIAALNSLLHAVVEVNPDCLRLAARADRERRKAGGYIGGLHGVPVLLKDNIATLDMLNTTAGSYALLGSKVPRDAGVVTRLRKHGAIVLGKANLSEWANFRSTNSSSGWSARGGQTRNPYVLSATPCGSSSGSAVSVAANLVAVSLGTETDGSIICPASWNAVVGIKPTVGLTSRAGVVPVSHNQDTVGPLCRTVADAVEVLDAIVGLDELDISTAQALRFIPKGGYKQFLKVDGLRRKRIGIVEHLFLDLGSTASDAAVVDELVLILRKMGAEIVRNATIPGMDDIVKGQSEEIVLLYDFKHDLNSYLANLVASPVRTLAEVIAFNNHHANEELSLFGQDLFILAEKTIGFQSKIYREAVNSDRLLTSNGIDWLLSELKLDAVAAPSSSSIASVAGIGGYPGISLPAGYSPNGVPFGITFIGKAGSEPTLIEIAYSLEQATRVRKPPTFQH